MEDEHDEYDWRLDPEELAHAGEAIGAWFEAHPGAGLADWLDDGASPSDAKELSDAEVDQALVEWEADLEAATRDIRERLGVSEELARNIYVQKLVEDAAARAAADEARMRALAAASGSAQFKAAVERAYDPDNMWREMATASRNRYAYYGLRRYTRVAPRVRSPRRIAPVRLRGRRSRRRSGASSRTSGADPPDGEDDPSDLASGGPA